ATEVSDPSKFGVLVHNSEGRVLSFAEKPKTFVGSWINAGVYILNKSCISRIPLAYCSLEKEVFPRMAAEGKLFCWKLSGYWADIGQPKDFLRGMSLFLEDLRVNRETRERKETPASGSLPEENLSKDDSLEDCAECPGLICMPSQELALVDGPQFVGNVLVDPSAVIGEGSILGPNVTVDKDVIIGRGCRLKNCALMRGVHISDFSWIDSSIVGWQSSVGKWVRVEGLTVVGENVHLLDECFINGAFILPHKTITESISESGAIIM
ncbi:mannose-1-phosphate guanyltransferase beta, partial [Cyclospora cayetanensis]|uniref:Mannose-1-phosphate guanyltransferase beta n=1 Tax=Cyclospora cayetanensis TaxID=88456 RepID=A0A6P6S1Z6_9EIME